eukprot:GHVL01009719.1.p3 GENE.GHVL01009719.1~~GHVL01009719.1.p3  ORF type:complete len:112 (+),score=15.71 GHVL01009719.1:328-663(+)
MPHRLLCQPLLHPGAAAGARHCLPCLPHEAQEELEVVLQHPGGPAHPGERPCQPRKAAHLRQARPQHQGCHGDAARVQQASDRLQERHSQDLLHRPPGRDLRGRLCPLDGI